MLNAIIYVTKFDFESIGISYAKGIPDQGEEIFNALKNYLGERSVATKDATLLAQRQVEYYAQFTHKNIQSGAYKIIEENQGIGNVFFGGAIMNFDLSEAVAAHSKRMATKVAKFLKGKDSSIVDDLLSNKI